MSIIGQAATSSGLGYFLLAALLPLLIARWLGILKWQGVLGPVRAAQGQAWSVLVLLLVGMTAWIGTQTLWVSLQKMHWKSAGHSEPFDLSTLTGQDYAFLATVPGLIAAFAVLISLAIITKPNRPTLGLSLTKLPRGLWTALCAMLLVMPLIAGISGITESIYESVHFVHPSEHELLKVMKDSTDPKVKQLVILGAVAAAPLIEEILFRGLLQTLLVSAFNGKLDRERDTNSPNRAALGRWLAILITSTLFASVHAAWTAPPIFVLAFCLGIIYERTGNLWATIALHAMFNGSQTLLFLGMQ